MRYRFIQEHAEELPVGKMCQVLKVSRSGYYDWRARPKSKRQERQEQLTEQIRQSYEENRRVYGSPKVTVDLQEKGVKVCRNTVARLMRKAGISSKVKRRFVVHTTDSKHDHPVASNTLARRFDDWEKPNLAWCCDITYVATDQGFLYLAAVMDLCSRKIVGWAMADHLRAELCLDALGMALEQRRPGEGLLHHSDRGVQYACEAYQSLLEERGITCSMSGVGNCYDNAAMESFFGTLKTELVYHERYATHEEARRSIFEYIEVFYNRQRRHSALGYKSPVAFEASLN